MRRTFSSSSRKARASIHAGTSPGRRPMAHEQDDAVWLHAERRVTIVELAECCGLPEDVLRELVDYGALSPADPAASELAFNARCVATVRMAVRLSNDLELET